MHSAKRVISVSTTDDPSQRIAELELACGCIVTRTLAADRLLELAGEIRAIGKYPCPAGHPVRRPG